MTAAGIGDEGRARSTFALYLCSSPAAVGDRGQLFDNQVLDKRLLDNQVLDNQLLDLVRLKFASAYKQFVILDGRST